MSVVAVDGDSSEVEIISDYGDYHDGIRDMLTPPTSLHTKHSSQKIVILYVIGIFLAIVLVIAMGYVVKLNFKSWLPKRKHFCDFTDCFRQNNGKKRKFFHRSNHHANFTIPVVIVSDENGQYLNPEDLFAEEFETRNGAHIFP